LDRLFDGACRLSEGIATGPDGMVYFSDITFSALCKDPSGKYPQAGNIWKYDPKSKQATIFRSPSGMSKTLKRSLRQPIVGDRALVSFLNRRAGR
jgi:gluconolactonase